MRKPNVPVLAQYGLPVSTAEYFVRHGVAGARDEAIAALAAELREQRAQITELQVRKDTILQLVADDLISHEFGGPWSLQPLARDDPSTHDSDPPWFLKRLDAGAGLQEFTTLEELLGVLVMVAKR